MRSFRSIFLKIEMIDRNLEYVFPYILIIVDDAIDITRKSDFIHELWYGQHFRCDYGDQIERRTIYNRVPIEWFGACADVCA